MSRLHSGENHMRSTLFALALLALTVPAFAWTPEANLTPGNTLWETSSSLAVDTANNTHVVYIREINSSLWKIYDQHTTTPGGPFTAEAEVTPLNIKEPEVAITAGLAGKVYIVSIGRGGAYTDYTIFFREWNGASWSSATQISDGTSYSA